MKASRKTLDLFAHMYEERTLRDYLYAAMGLCVDGSHEAEVLRRFAKRHNTESNRAMMALNSMGYSAYRDEEAGDTPTLVRNGETVAYWHEHEGVIELQSDPDEYLPRYEYGTIEGFSEHSEIGTAETLDEAMKACASLEADWCGNSLGEWMCLKGKMVASPHGVRNLAWYIRKAS